MFGFLSSRRSTLPLAALAAASLPFWPTAAGAASQYEAKTFTVPGEGFSCEFTAWIYVHPDEHYATIATGANSETEDARCRNAYHEVYATVELRNGNQLQVSGKGGGWAETIEVYDVERLIRSDHVTSFLCDNCARGVTIEPK